GHGQLAAAAERRPVGGGDRRPAVRLEPLEQPDVDAHEGVVGVAGQQLPDVEAKDPANTLLARQSRLRLPAELIRDQALSAAGLLDPRIGGPSVRPAQPKGVAELSYGGSVKWVE